MPNRSKTVRKKAIFEKVSSFGAIKWRRVLGQRVELGRLKRIEFLRTFMRRSKKADFGAIVAIITLAFVAIVALFKVLAFIVTAIFEFFESRKTNAIQNKTSVDLVVDDKPKNLPTVQRPRVDFVVNDVPKPQTTTAIQRPRIEISTSISSRRFSNNFKDYFVPAGKSVSVGPYTIANGLIYFLPQKPPRDTYSYGEDEPSAIYPTLPIGNGFDFEGRTFSYWPSYSQIPPDARNTYLKWLSEGAEDPAIATGYVFIYFYGLERRLVLDCQDEAVSERDRDIVVAEVSRLKEIYQTSGSFRGYSSRLLEWMNIDEAIQKVESGKVISINECIDNETLATLKISGALKLNGYVKAEEALLWFKNYHPGVARKYLIKNNFDAVLSGFKPIFDKAFPNGLKTRERIESLELRYQGAEMGLSSTRRLEGWPHLRMAFDTRTLQSLLKSLNDLLDELAPHVRWLQANDAETLPVIVIAKRPKILWTDSAKKMAETVSDFVSKSFNADNHFGLISIQSLMDVLGYKTEKFSKKDQKILSDVLRNIGYFADPDQDIFDISLTAKDMFVLTDQKFSDIKSNVDFKLAVLTLKLCAAASWIDGKVSPQESSFIEARILPSFKLNDDQKKRLLFYLRWLLAYDHQLNNFKRLVGKLSKPKKKNIASLMVAIVAIDGNVDPKEVEFLEKIYKGFDLDKDSLYSDLHSYQSDGAEVVKGSNESVKINQQKVQKKIAESAEVGSILADVFKGDMDSKDESEDVETEKVSTVLEPRLARLIKKILTKDVWSLKELESVTKEEGFLINGAIESVNEWAFEELGDALLEEGDDSIVVSTSLKSDALKLVAEAA